ncbi:MAG TPA: choice-of-anchor A family protein, partial [Thermoanaerobaculia bacterium]|nr:choice-of-anchor A family protein [Thermoanaerobaculia bacterium]
GTATAGADYTATNGRVELAAGATSATASVPVLADNQSEPQESFFLDLAPVSGAVLVDGTGEARIVDPRGCVPKPLGTANDFNLFLFESLQQNSSKTGGRLAVGGDAQLNSYNVGEDLPGIGGNVVVVGGHLTFNQGTVRHGDVVYGLPSTLQGVNIPEGVARQGTAIDFAAQRTSLQQLSTSLGSLAANGNTTVGPGMPIELTGSNATLNVFSVAGTDLTNASGITITAPAGSSVLINVTGTAIVVQNFTFSMSGVTRGEVMFNFPQATSFIAQNLTIQGSLLAPRAVVQLNNGEIRGTLVARTLQGNGQTSHGPFNGCLPLPTASTFCPRSPGYWKNHTSAWPVQQLQLGAVVYNQSGILTLLNYGGTDAATKLARALASTKLNQASGFSHPNLPAIVQQADAFLASHAPGSNPRGAAQTQANNLKSQLEAYYEGVQCN